MRTLIVALMIWAYAVSHTTFEPTLWLWWLDVEVVQGTPVPAR